MSKNLPQGENLEFVEVTGEEKLDDYTKPFTQVEVTYVMTSPDVMQRCEVCRFYRQKNQYDPCLLVPNDNPYPIVSGGTCNQFSPIPEPRIQEIANDAYDEYAPTTNAQGRWWDPLKRLLPKKRDVDKALLAIDFKTQPRGFVVIKSLDKAYWLAWYSNNFEDREEDIFAEEGFDFYNRMVSSKVWPAPELWSMHQEYLKHGEGLITFRIGHFQFALGEFDDSSQNPLVEPFIKFYEANPVTMSHGFYFDPEKYINKIFYRWRTFEVSTIKPGREANSHYTQLSVEKGERMLTGSDREFVEKIIGKDQLAALEKSSDERGKALQAAGISFKAAGDPPPGADDDEEEDDAAAGGKPKDPKKPKKELSPESELFALTMLKVAEKFQGSSEDTAKVVNIAASAMIQSDERLGALEQAVNRIKLTLLELLDPKGSASRSLSSLIPDDNEAANLLVQRNHGKGDTSQLSMLEQLAISVGDDTAYGNGRSGKDKK